MKRPPSHTLDARLRDFVLIASLFATGDREKAIPVVKAGLRMHRCTERTLSELFLHISLLLGFPSMLEGLSMLRLITGKSDSQRRTIMSERDKARRGKAALKRVYGRAYGRLLENLKSLHRDLPVLITRDVYGHMIARPGLSLKEREIVNVAVLGIQRLNQQLFSHIRGALRLGVPPKTIRSAILISARVSGINPSSSLSILSSLAANRD